MIYGKIVEKINLEGKKIIFRYPEPKDLDGLLNLINSLVREKAMIGVQKKQTRKEEKKWLSNLLKDIKNRETVYLVVEMDNKIVGGASVRKFKEPIQNHIGEFGITLKKEIRGKGVGSRLIKRTIKEAKKSLKLKIIILGTMIENKKAQKLYKRSGFENVGIIKGGLKYYKRLADDIVMAKYL